MLSIKQKNILLNNMVEQLELPDSAYQKAEDRYKDLGEWLCRDDSRCSIYSPYIFPQGSFRLGTAIRPLNEKEEYDLDLACNLKAGVTKETNSQYEVKNLVGNEIENYRIARNIKEPMEEKHRCWRIEYSDHIKFHIDIIPCIPESQLQKSLIKKALENENYTPLLANSVSELTVSLTDDRHPDYRRICSNWKISNPEGYASWFESRMRLASLLLQERAEFFKTASIDDLPYYKWKTPLQFSIQLLKRHRDQIYKNAPDLKPISIIITTLAAKAYQGETDIYSALNNILQQMENLINYVTPRIPNPVNPKEDFADKWSTREGQQLKLEENFMKWLQQARIDFENIYKSDNAKLISELANQKFSTKFDSSTLQRSLALITTPNITHYKDHNIEVTPKPWRK